MIYSLEELKNKIKNVADRYDIDEIKLFGSYYNRNATGNSDIDLIVTYGNECRGLNRIQFIEDLETELGKEVDVINIKFQPDFMKSMDLNNPKRTIYKRQF